MFIQSITLLDSFNIFIKVEALGEIEVATKLLNIDAEMQVIFIWFSFS